MNLPHLIWGYTCSDIRLSLYTLACAIAGLEGAFYAHFARFISADQLGGNESFAILTMVALGGTGSIIGPLIGAAVLVLFPEVFRFLAQSGW
jgi:branched-chain amino acid transport system permease protein